MSEYVIHFRTVNDAGEKNIEWMMEKEMKPIEAPRNWPFLEKIRKALKEESDTKRAMTK